MRRTRFLLGGLFLAISFPADAFVREVQTGTGTAAHWTTFPVVYSFNARGTPEVSGTQEFDAVRAAFATWAAVPNTGLTFTEAGSTVTNGVSILDGVNTILWIDDPSHRLLQATDLVAQTITYFPAGDAHIQDADLVFDGAHFTFTDSGNGNFAGSNGTFDIQAVATHEIGHFIGLDHVTTAGSTMFPRLYAGSTAFRTLSQDEVSAVQFVYPPVSPPPEGTISGTVSRTGVGVKRPYVVAFQNGTPVVGVVADAAGVYKIRRVPAGNYLVRVQPFTLSSQIVASPFYQTSANVDVDFLAMWYPSATTESSATSVTVTAGADTPNINFAVSATGNQGDPFEADNGFGTAKAITTSLGQAQLKHFYDPGNPGGGGANDQDWVTFTAVAGHLYVIDTRNPGLRRDNNTSDAATIATLYDQNGTTIIKSNTSRNRLESQPVSRIAYFDSASGVRYVQVQPRDTSSAGAGAGAYYEILVRDLGGAFAGPTISAVQASQATQTGGVVVTIQGTHFLPGATAVFGGVAATEEDAQDCVSETDCRALKAIIPAHAPGMVTVQVTNPDGQVATLANGFTYLAQQAGTFTDGTFGAFGDYIGNGTTVCWGDYDGDGYPDLFAPFTHHTGGASGVLLRNNGSGTFVDVTTTAGLDTSGMAFIVSCAWGDYDNDGDLDLYIVYGGTGSSNRLYRNNGNGTFTNVAASALVTGNTSLPKLDAAWADYDHDGKLDLYLAYGSGGTDQLFHNNGGVNPTFTDLAASAGIAVSGQGGRVLWADYDNDGNPDVYRLRRSGQADLLFHNNGDGTFTDVTTHAGIVEGSNCFDAAWADFNNDGFLDLLCVADSLNGSPSQRFWINQKNGSFVDQAAASGINSLGRSAKAITVLDRDNDGTPDAYLGCSFLNGFPGAELDALLQNNGATVPVFSNVSVSAGTDESGYRTNSNAAASADVDGDGFTDILSVGQGDGNTEDDYLWRGSSNTNQWLRVRLHGTISNSWGIGASVTVIAHDTVNSNPDEAHCLADASGIDARRQEVIGGSLSQNSMELEFGLNTRPNNTAYADCVIVSWPKSGFRRAYTRIGVNNLLEVSEDNPTTTVTRVSPSFGTTAGGTAATVTGFLFKTGAAVSFGGSAASVSSVYGSYPCPDASDPTPCYHFIDLTTPAHAAGAVDVTVTDPSATPATLTSGYAYVAPGTAITLTMSKDTASNGVKLLWTDIGQGRYRVRRATGPTPADFAVGFQTIVTGTQYIDAGVLSDGQSYYYKVDEGGI